MHPAKLRMNRHIGRFVSRSAVEGLLRERAEQAARQLPERRGLLQRYALPVGLGVGLTALVLAMD